ncbi:RidA family protein [Pyruvatibacter mobilis]|uniref:RidA family protein n=1 Tax=Pyruvatibacter mobilis TaxID=1712261 RepID=UPI003BA8C5E7
MQRIEPDFNNCPETHANGILTGKDLFVAGQVGVDPSTGKHAEGIAAQAAAALANFKSVVEAANGGLGDITKLTIYIADMAALQTEMAGFMRAFSDVFGKDHVPAMTLVGVTALMSQDYLVEIEGHARIGGDA